MLLINQQAPDLEFEIYHQQKIKRTKLSKFKNKWLILLFYPADFSYICPTELEEAQRFYKQFQKEIAEIISISTDSVYAHQAWHEASSAIRKINYPMAADPNGKISKLFGTYIEAEGVSLRASFILNPKRAVKSLEMHDNSIGRNIGEILRKLQAVKYTQEHKGELCPVNWQPAQKTLKPGLDLVGKT